MPKKSKKIENNKSIKNNEKKANKFLELFKSYEEPEDNKNNKLKEMMKTEDLKTNTSSTKSIIISLVIGFFIGLMVMGLIIPDRIAKLENGQEVIVEIKDKIITADNLYKDMKNNYAINYLIQNIDNIILSDLYPEDNDMKTAINETADYYIATYETYYGYSLEQFLNSNGFKSRNEFLEQLKLDYRRNKYYKEYVKSLITDKEINDFYNARVFGEIGTKYISINIEEDSNKTKLILQTILQQLEDGYTYEDIVKKYKTDIKYEDLGYISFDTEIDNSYLNILKKLSNNTYSTVPIKSSTDYKIIFRTNQKEKEELDIIKDRIIKSLALQKENDDKTLYYKALNQMRIDNKVIIKDTELAMKYNNYIKEVTNN